MTGFLTDHRSTPDSGTGPTVMKTSFSLPDRDGCSHFRRGKSDNKLFTCHLYIVTRLACFLTFVQNFGALKVSQLFRRVSVQSVVLQASKTRQHVSPPSRLAQPEAPPAQGRGAEDAQEAAGDPRAPPRLGPEGDGPRLPATEGRPVAGCSKSSRDLPLDASAPAGPRWR